MSPEPTTVRLSSVPLFGTEQPGKSPYLGIGGFVPKLTQPVAFSKRIRILTTELRHQAPEWAARLAQARTEREFLEIVGQLFNLTHALSPSGNGLASDVTLATRLTTFVHANLHKGPTLKMLSGYLGYSEKYCSDLFQTMTGESFSEHLKRCRLDRATALLTRSEKRVSEIAAALGFSDQFAFSHFFKRATGRSPVQFRSASGRSRHKTSQVEPERLS